jgi:hypothetical protein
MKKLIVIASVLFSSAASAHTEVILNSGVIQSVNANVFTVESSHKLISVKKADVLKSFNFKKGSKVYLVKYVMTKGFNDEPFYSQVKVIKHSLLPAKIINRDLELIK